MGLVATLKLLIENGEKLAPQGGDTYDGWNGHGQPEYGSWRLQSIAAVEELGQAGRPLLREIESDKDGSYFYAQSALRILGVLKAALALAERSAGRKVEKRTVADPTADENAFRKVFVVHGHDVALLQQVARFLEKLNLIPIILFEQAGKSQTIIEKLESSSDVRYAVVLLTPDDVGRAANDKKLRPRGRQNVILELGYFIAKLDRPNVTALYVEGVELPSDYRGVEYVNVDAEGAWKMKLARELKEAGLPVDMNDAI